MNIKFKKGSLIVFQSIESQRIFYILFLENYHETNITCKMLHMTNSKIRIGKHYHQLYINLINKKVWQGNKLLYFNNGNNNEH